MIRFRNAAVVALWLLSACGEPAWNDFGASEPKSMKTDIGVYLFETSLYSGTQSATPALAAAPRRKPAHYVAGPPERPFVADPQRLLGLNFEAAKALLGDPALHVEEPPAKIWAYNGGICRLNVYFYPRVDDEIFNVLAYEVTDGAPSAIGAELATEPEDQPPEADILAGKANGENARRCLAVLLASRDSPQAR